MSNIEAEYKLLPHQNEAIRFMKAIEADKKSALCGGIIGLKMGMGKTFTLLSHIANSPKKQGNAPNLVVAPKTALFTWKCEIEKFYKDQLKVLIFHNDYNRINLINRNLLDDYDIVLINYETIRNVFAKQPNYYLSNANANMNESGSLIGLQIPIKPIHDEMIGEEIIFSVKWNMIIADESHNFANSKTKLWRAMMCLAADFRYCLTGTPIRNWDLDIYSQMKFLGYRDSENKFSIKNFSRDYPNIKKFIHYKEYSNTTITLPPITKVVVNTQFYPLQEQLYAIVLAKIKKIFKDEKYAFGEKSSDDFAAILRFFTRLRQICIAPYSILNCSKRKAQDRLKSDEWIFANDDEKDQLDMDEKEEKKEQELTEEQEFIKDWLYCKDFTSGLIAPKVEKCIEIIQSIPKGEKIIIFTTFKCVIDLCMELLSIRCPERTGIFIDGDVKGLKRDEKLFAFKSKPNVDVLFISFKLGSESLNLTEANNIILLEPQWSPATIEQAKARVHRMGQTKSVKIYEVVMERSIEINIIKLCQDKQACADFMLGKKDKFVRNESTKLTREKIAEILGYNDDEDDD